MGMTYQNRRRPDMPVAGKSDESRTQGPSIERIAAGAAPTQEQMGHQVDLPGTIREKMESSFGADFSNVKIYESQTVADAGARAVARGDSVVFAPGQFDTVSSGGQALLGHELSHIVSQARGESRGSGLLRDRFLESQADRQGQLAAAGQSAYSGPVTPVGVSTAASAAGPIQADKPWETDSKPKKPAKPAKPAKTPREITRASNGDYYSNKTGNYAFHDVGTFDSYELLEKAAKNPEKYHHQIHSKDFQDKVLREYVNMAKARLDDPRHASRTAAETAAFRSNPGEMLNFAKMLRLLMTDEEKGALHGAQTGEEAYRVSIDMMKNNPELSRFLAGTKEVYKGNHFYENNPDAMAANAINNFMLRGTVAELGKDLDSETAKQNRGFLMNQSSFAGLKVAADENGTELDSKYTPAPVAMEALEVFKNLPEYQAPAEAPAMVRKFATKRHRHYHFDKFSQEHRDNMNESENRNYWRQSAKEGSEFSNEQYKLAKLHHHKKHHSRA